MAHLYAEWPICIGIVRGSEHYIDVDDADWKWTPFPAVVWPGVEGAEHDVTFRPSNRFAMLMAKRDIPLLGRFLCLPPTKPFMHGGLGIAKLRFTNEGAGELALVFGSTQRDYLTDEPGPQLASWSTQYQELGLPVVNREYMVNDAFALQFVEEFNKIEVPAWPSTQEIVMPIDMIELPVTTTSASKPKTSEPLNGVYIPEGW